MYLTDRDDHGDSIDAEDSDDSSMLLFPDDSEWSSYCNGNYNNAKLHINRIVIMLRCCHLCYKLYYFVD